ncbi:MAG: carboxypeptidase-like regulatory domain-containing protein [Bacteroidetes bacterium]|nr:carboxypeptidase-like regulatory domain-containing protein [Bacteroidota bacterium]
MQKIIALLLCLGALTKLNAQNFIDGHIYGTSDAKSEMLPGANVFVKGNKLIFQTDQNGYFQLKNITLPDTLVISYTGYTSKTLAVNEQSKGLKIYLQTTNTLNAVEVEAVQSGTQISTIKTRNTETITQKEILRAACCNLSESFETNPTVNVNYTDAVTGAKEIQLLGLSGIYSQLLTENINSSIGLTQPYGLAFIPGPWMESIQISKGAGSVVNGYEGLSGSINVEFIKPEVVEEKAYINLFATSMKETEANFYSVHHLDSAQRWNMIMMLHGNLMQDPFDHNDDGFADVPLRQQINFYNRIRYSSGKKIEGQFGIKALADVRESGQLQYLKAKDAKASFGSENQK